MQLPFTISLRPSRRLAVLLVAAHGGVALALTGIASSVAHGPALWLVLALLPGVVVSLVLQLRCLFGARRIVLLTLHKDGTAEYQCHDGAGGTGRVDAQSTVTPWLTVMLLHKARQRGIALTLLPDALTEEDFRRLRLWLRWLAVSDAA